MRYSWYSWIHRFIGAYTIIHSKMVSHQDFSPWLSNESYSLKIPFIPRKWPDSRKYKLFCQQNRKFSSWNKIWNPKFLFLTKQVCYERTNKTETFWTSELNKKILIVPDIVVIFNLMGSLWFFENFIRVGCFSNRW